jgi:hypothetical protein
MCVTCHFTTGVSSIEGIKVFHVHICNGNECEIPFFHPWSSLNKYRSNQEIACSWLLIVYTIDVFVASTSL